MSWTTYNNTVSTKLLIPGTYAAPSTVAVPATTTGGIVLIPAAAGVNVRFANISIQPLADANGNPIRVFLGIGMVPTTSLFSFEMLSGHQEYNLQINGQAITAIAQSGTINVQIQIAPSLIINL